MAINSGFEPDNGDATQPTENKNTSNQQQPNENTSFGLNLDTYFSDEKIPIPDRVSNSIIV